MEADNRRLPQGICPLTNGWQNHIRENWHDFLSVHHWLILTIVPITLVMVTVEVFRRPRPHLPPGL